MEGVIILVLLFVGGGIALIIWDMNRISKRTAGLKAEVQKHIDMFDGACKNSKISIPQIDFSSATMGQINAWIQQITKAVRKVLESKKNDFRAEHNITSQFCSSKSSELGMCCTSHSHFFYRINFCSEKVQNYITPDVRIVEDKKPLDNVKFEDNKEILGYNVVAGKTKVKAERYFDVLRSFVSNQTSISYNSITLDDIIHFRVEGQVEHVSKVSGSGGGANIEGAVKGGVMFGVAGAIVGSQIGTETTISTEIIKKDNRKIVLSYMQNGIMKTETISSSDPETTIQVMRKLIPQKEQSVSNFTQSVPTKETLPPKTIKLENQQSSLSQIKELKELLDIGAITQEEFEAKKKQLLGL